MLYEDSDMENSTGGCEKIGTGVLGLAPCHFSEKRKLVSRYVILASQNDFTLLNRRLRWSFDHRAMALQIFVQLCQIKLLLAHNACLLKPCGKLRPF